MALYKGKTIISDNGSNIIVDDQLNLESTNPVQNKIITTKFEEIDKRQSKFTVDTISSGANLNDYQEIGFYQYIPEDPNWKQNIDKDAYPTLPSHENYMIFTVVGDDTNTVYLICYPYDFWATQKYGTPNYITFYAPYTVTSANLIQYHLENNQWIYDRECTEIFINSTIFTRLEYEFRLNTSGWNNGINILYNSDTIYKSGDEGVKDKIFTESNPVPDDTIINKPTKYPFFLTIGKSNNKAYQIVYSYDNKIYTRQEETNGWLNWKEINGNSEIVVDSELSETSENPVQNKVITEKLNEVFQSVSNGKTLVASAITDKGIVTEATDTFKTMADNIGMIESGTGSRVNTYGMIALNNRGNLTTSANAEITS